MNMVLTILIDVLIVLSLPCIIWCAYTIVLIRHLRRMEQQNWRPTWIFTYLLIPLSHCCVVGGAFALWFGITQHFGWQVGYSTPLTISKDELVVIAGMLITGYAYFVVACWYQWRVAPHHRPGTARLVHRILIPLGYVGAPTVGYILTTWIARRLGWLTGPGEQWHIPASAPVLLAIDAILFIALFIALNATWVYFSRHRSNQAHSTQ